MGYLCGKFPGGEEYYPLEPAAKALVDQRLFFDIDILYRSVWDNFSTYINLFAILFRYTMQKL
jgi:hypothetical protein